MLVVHSGLSPGYQSVLGTQWEIGPSKVDPHRKLAGWEVAGARETWADLPLLTVLHVKSAVDSTCSPEGMAAPTLLTP